MATKILRNFGRSTNRHPGGTSGEPAPVDGIDSPGEGSDGDANPDELEIGSSFSATDSSGSYDPRTRTDDSDDGTGDAQPGNTSDGRKRRGRKPGSKNRQARATVDLSGIETILLSIHNMGTVWLGVPHLDLEKEEAEKIRKGIEAVAREYPHRGLSSKTVAWFQLCTALGSAYGPRAMVLRDILRDRAEERKKNANPVAQKPHQAVPQPIRETPKPQASTKPPVVPRADDVLYPPAQGADYLVNE